MLKGTSLENLNLLCSKSQKSKSLTMPDLNIDLMDALPLLKSILTLCKQKIYCEIRKSLILLNFYKLLR
jgi:hypothetical protein